MSIGVALLVAALASGVPRGIEQDFVGGRDETSLMVHGPLDWVESLGVEVRIVGAYVADTDPVFVVRSNGSDFSVNAELMSERREDANGDGTLEIYEAEFHLDLNNGRRPPGHHGLSLVVQMGDTRAADHMTFRRHAFLGLSETEIASWMIVDKPDFVVEASGVDIRALDLFVYEDGVDSTEKIVASRVPADVTTDDDTGMVNRRLDAVLLDLSGVRLGANLLFMAVTTSMEGDTYTDVLAANISDAYIGLAGLGSQGEACLDTFMDDIGASKDESGNVSISASPGEVAAAAKDLMTCLAGCEPVWRGGTSSGTTDDGWVYKFAWKTSGRDSTASSTSADIVLAVGDVGSGSTAGGDASATNTNSGGAAVAVGGEGGGSGSSCGDGGSATSSAGSGGDAVSAGGAGGIASDAGGDGGNGTATTTGGGSATAWGGNGGDPTNNSETGGDGGGASVTHTSPYYHASGAGSSGSAGYHGAGAHGTANNSGANVSAGQPIANT